MTPPEDPLLLDSTSDAPRESRPGGSDPPRFLVVEDDPSMLEYLQLELQQLGYEAVLAASGREALARLHSDLAGILLDLGLPDISGLALLTRLRAKQPAVPVVVLTASGRVEDVRDCIQAGAKDYLQKPVERERLERVLQNSVQEARLHRRVDRLLDLRRATEGTASFVTQSADFLDVVRRIELVAGTELTVLLEGESGVGKEVAARAVHVESSRSENPFVAVNCGAIPPSMIEAELFGHTKGAFTGATQARKGHFEAADGGTLFLDEVGSMELATQSRLLRVVQEREVQPLGAPRPIPVNVRLIVATNQDLRELVQAGSFREDLYFRLAVCPVRIPPLRERREDVPLLAQTFLGEAMVRQGKAGHQFTPAFLAALGHYDWPGNVRELRNAVDRALALAPTDQIDIGLLPDALLDGYLEREVDGFQEDDGGESGNGAEMVFRSGTLEELERQAVEAALEDCRWNVSAAARRLGISRATIYRKMEAYGISKSSNGPSQSAESRYHQLRDRFLTRLRGELPEFEAQLAAEDWEGLAARAHRVGGAAGQFGFTAASRSALELETALQEEALQPERLRLAQSCLDHLKQISGYDHAE